MKIREWMMMGAWALLSIGCTKSPSEMPQTPEETLRLMTRREKVDMVVGQGWGSLFSGFNIPLTGRPRVPGAAGMTRGIKRLGIMPTVLSDGPAGVRVKPVFRTLAARRAQKAHRYDGQTLSTIPLKDKMHCTAFPVGTMLASSWDEALQQEVGAAMGNEARELGIDVLLAPGMNLMRTPMCGRNYEYLSEDPLLTGKTAAALVRGIQSQGVGACIKHIAANNQETNRLHNSSEVDSTTLRDMYLRPFEIAIREGRPWTAMSSYNALNGTLTQYDHQLLTEWLRGEAGFDGIVMTDWTGVRDADRQVRAGNDLLMPGMKRQRWQLMRALRRGNMSDQELDTAALRMLRFVWRTQSQHMTPYTLMPDFRSHAQLARRAAADGMVLLEMDQAPLLDSTAHRVALFGASGYDLVAGGTGSGYVNRPYTVTLEQGLHEAGFRVDSVLASGYHRYALVSGNRIKASGMKFMQRFLGHGALRERHLDASHVASAAQRNDVAVVALGRHAGEGKDREVKDDWLLTEAEQALLDNVSREFHALGKRVVVVLNVPAPIEMASWRHRVDAILLAWCPGQEGGNAMADVLTGKVCPSGRLTMTWPLRLEDLPAMRNFPHSTDKKHSYDKTLYAERDTIGYRHQEHWAHDGVAYPFGYGLSYTTFEVDTLRHPDGTPYYHVRNTGRFPARHVLMHFSPTSPHELLWYYKTEMLEPEPEEVRG